MSNRSNKKRFEYFDNYRDYMMFLRARFFDIGTNVIRWDSDTLSKMKVPLRVPEKYLYDNGMFCYVNYKKLGPMLLPVAQGSIKYNPYGEPSNWRAYATGNFAGEINSIRLHDGNSVIVRNNSSRTPTRLGVEYFIKRLVNIEATWDTNLNAHKIPFIFETDEDNIEQMKNVYKAIMNCSPIYFKGNLMDKANIFYNNTPYVVDKLREERVAVYNECLNFLGIDNLPIEKKERLLTGEVEVNGEEINLTRSCSMNERKIGCDIINELMQKDGYDYHLTVEVNKDIAPKLEEQMEGEDGTDNSDGTS